MPRFRTLFVLVTPLLLAGTIAAMPADGDLAGRSIDGSVRRHLRLVKAEPAADSTIAASPAAIRLWFSQRPELGVTRVQLTGPAGAVPLARLTRAEAKDAPIVAALTSAVPPGAYTVAWRTMADDGHVVSGTFRFTVGANGDTR